MRARLLLLSLVVATVLSGAVLAVAAPAWAQATPSTLVVDRTVEAPATPNPHSHLWVGLVVGAFGLAGLVWSRAFRPVGPVGPGDGQQPS